MAYVTDTQLASTITPQGASLVGYSAAIAGSVGRTVLSKIDEDGALTPEDFGAVGNGSHDDSVALQNWLNAIGKPLTGSTTAFTYGKLGSKTYCTSQFLAIPQGNNGSIVGTNRYLSTIRYIGAATSGDILTLGDSSYETIGWSLLNFTINSATQMIGGHAIHLIRNIFTQLDNVIIDGAYGTDGQTPANFTLWNGIFFEGFLVCRVAGIDIKARATGFKMSDLSGSETYGAGMYIGGGGAIARCGQHGIWIGGGAGGVEIDDVDIDFNSQLGSTYANVWIDTTLSNSPNREIFFGDRCTIDSSGGYGVYVNDAINGVATLRFTGTWVASSHLTDIYIKAWGGTSLPSLISLVGAKVYNGNANGFECVDPNPHVLISGCEFSYHLNGYGVVASSNVRTRSSLMYRNSLGDWSGSVITDTLNDTPTYFQDNKFSAYINSGNPILNFDNNDFIQYNRTADQMNFYTGGILGFQLSGSTGGLFPNGASFGDANYSNFLSAGKPTVNFDSNDFIQYNRTADQMGFFLGGVLELQISSSIGALLPNGASFGDTNYSNYLAAGKPTINFDSNDFIQFDRTANRINFFVGGVCHFYIDSTGPHTV